MYNHQDLVRAHHEQFVRDSLQLSRSRRLVAARKARRRAERAACLAREAALQALLAQQSLL
jgi:hypothetical protein